MTNQQFKDFLEGHPSIKLVTFSKECGLSESAIHKLKSGELKMSDRLSKAIEPVAVKYGFNIEATVSEGIVCAKCGAKTWTGVHKEIYCPNCKR